MSNPGLSARAAAPGTEAPEAQLREMLRACRRAVVFTGAGISTESGIPDFRSPGGLWSRYRPIEFQDFLASEAERREYWRRKFELEPVIGAAAPNAGHHAVARLVRSGRAACVITQNIDGLHQKAGVPEDRVVELHGNTTYALCLQCGTRFELAEIRVRFERSDRAPDCTACGGMVKTATVSFGQPMPADAMARAQQETLACDLFLVAGSSLAVYPAAGFPQLAAQNGAALVIVNREPTPLDALARLVLHREIGPVLDYAAGASCRDGAA